MVRTVNHTQNTLPMTKRQEVLGVAAEYFLRDGFEGTSINAMARESGISKESIYRYFGSKKELFEAVIAKELADYRQRFDFLDIEHSSLPLVDLLTRVGETILQAVISDRSLALRRLVFQEAVQSPEIGQLYFEFGPQSAYVWLEHLFDTHCEKLAEDPMTLAFRFPALLLHRLMLQRECGVIDSPSEEEISKHAAAVAREFNQMYFEMSGNV